jgi:hypothetical protein
MARTVLDSCLKHVLEEAEVTYKRFDNILELYDKVIRIFSSGDWRDSFRGMLQDCRGLVEKLSRIRGDYGDVHGTGEERPFADATQAEMVVNVAGAVALFVIQSWKTHSASSRVS